MRTSHRLLLPWVLARVGVRASKAPGLSACRPDAVEAVARRSSPLPPDTPRARDRPAWGGLTGLPCGRGVFRPRPGGEAPIGTGLSHGSLFKVDQVRYAPPSRMPRP